MPSLDELGALIAMCVNPEHFTPQSPEGRKWPWPKGVHEDRERGHIAAAWLLSNSPQLGGPTQKWIEYIEEEIKKRPEEEPV